MLSVFMGAWGCGKGWREAVRRISLENGSSVPVNPDELFNIRSMKMLLMAHHFCIALTACVFQLRRLGESQCRQAEPRPFAVAQEGAVQARQRCADPQSSPCDVYVFLDWQGNMVARL